MPTESNLALSAFFAWKWAVLHITGARRFDGYYISKCTHSKLITDSVIDLIEFAVALKTHQIVAH